MNITTPARKRAGVASSGGGRSGCRLEFAGTKVETMPMLAGRSRGMTLIELLIVLAILAALAALVIPRFGNASDDARDTAAQRQLQVVRSALTHYRAEHVLAPVGVVSGTGWDDLRGSYLMVAPGNPLRLNQIGIVVGNAAPGTGSGAGPEHGWYWHTDHQTLYLIDADGMIVNE